MASVICRHCMERALYQRGLCYRCFNTLSIRAKYPARKSGTAGREKVEPVETLAELEALIESQRPTMPQERYADSEPWIGPTVSVRAFVAFSKRHNGTRIF